MTDETPTDRDGDETGDEIEPADVRAELDRQRTGSGVTDDTRRADDARDRGVEEFDEGFVELFSRALDTDRAARVYVTVRRRRFATVETVAADTGLYPEAVRETLADLHDEGMVERRGHTAGTEGDEPEYTAIPPSDLVGVMVDRAREAFDSRLAFDRRPADRSGSADRTPRSEPVTIEVEEANDRTAEDPGSDDGTLGPDDSGEE